MTGTVQRFGSVGILNVGEGDTKLVFDKANPAECIRAARIVTDLLRRGYALLVEVERDGIKKFERALSFREDACEYVIADFDPVTAAKSDEEKPGEEVVPASTATSPTPGGEDPPPRRRGRPKTRGVDATNVRSIAVARSAGG